MDRKAVTVTDTWGRVREYDSQSAYEADKTKSKAEIDKIKEEEYHEELIRTRNEDAIWQQNSVVY